MNNFPAQISPKEVAERPTDPYRIIGILEELRRCWDKSPNKTLGQILRRVVETEYQGDTVYTLHDDELLACIQNYLKDN
jgi:uncharacterized protein YihD (DUF1040 family)